MAEGKLFVIEGACDGIGKSTQYDLLKKRLKDEGYKIKTHHFPSYGTPQGKLVEEYLKGEYGKPEELSPYFINGLYAMDRAVTWSKKLKRLYDKGYIILLDRYTTSSLIYQSALIKDKKERKRFIDYVQTFEYEKIGIKSPDGVIFLDAPFEIVTNLRNKRTTNEGVQNDIHEENIEFMKKVYDNAHFVADYLKFDQIKCDDGSTFRSREDIHEEIYKTIKSKLR